MQEYYIRKIDSDESRGPFTIEQLSSLSEAGQVDPDTLLYDPDREEWETIRDLPEIHHVLFPEKKRLKIKAKDKIEMLNIESDEDVPISVDDMLAAAEGRTKDTKHHRNLDVLREKAVGIAMFSAALGLLLSGVALLLPSVDILLGFDITEILQTPFIIVGIVDLALALALFLRTSGPYPFIRFRTALGLGFFSFYFFLMEEPLLLATSAAGAIGIYALTLLSRPGLVALGVLLALGGMGGFAYLSILAQ